MNNRYDRIQHLEGQASQGGPYSNAHNELVKIMVKGNMEDSGDAKAALSRLRAKGDKFKQFLDGRTRGALGVTRELGGEQKKRVGAIDQKIKTKGGEIKKVVEKAEAGIRRVETPAPKPEQIAAENEEKKSDWSMIRQVQRMVQNARNYDPKSREIFLSAIKLIRNTYPTSLEGKTIINILQRGADFFVGDYNSHWAREEIERINKALGQREEKIYKETSGSTN